MGKENEHPLYKGKSTIKRPFARAAIAILAHSCEIAGFF